MTVARRHRRRTGAIVAGVLSLTSLIVACGADTTDQGESAATTPPPPVNAAPPIPTDAMALSEAAASFGAISSELKSSIAQVDSIAGDATMRMSGASGTAAQAAFLRFREAANMQVQLLDQITSEIGQAGAADPGSDDVGGQMEFGFSPVPLGDPALVSASQCGGSGFPGPDGAVASISGKASTINDLLDQGGKAVRKLAPVWGGFGSANYLTMQQRWDTTATELNASLRDLVTKLGEAAQGIEGAEGTAGMFD